MNKPTVIPLFPDLLYISDNIDVGNIDFDRVSWKKNIGNLGSNNCYILEHELFLPLKEKMIECINEYFYKILQVNKQTEIYITESWLNKTVAGQYHHQHNHSNSVVSGVLYLDCDPDATTGHINFKDSRYRQIDFDVIESNPFNTRGFSAVPKKGRLLLFPSNLEHKVDTYEGDIPRISLAFNTFVKNVLSVSRTQSLKI